MPSKSNLTTTAAVPIVATSTKARTGIQVRADPNNTAPIAIGYTSAVTCPPADPTSTTTDATDGIVLLKGDTYFVPAMKISGDAANLFVVPQSNGQRIIFDIVDKGAVI